MRHISLPTLTAAEAMDLCIESVRDRDLKRRLGVARRHLEVAETEYLRLGRKAKLYQMPESHRIGRSLTHLEMDELYNGTFVRSARTRSAYGKLKKACTNDICPLCGQRTVHQLDHYLPISRHALFGITASNLVPACSDCNKIKLAYVATTAAEQTLHPYFDDVEGERWLFAKVTQNPGSLLFFARPSVAFGKTIRERIKVHFETFSLATLYSSHAGAEISDIKHHLIRLSTRRGATARIRAYLQDQADSRGNAHVNSWQAATYEALAASTWFCGGGFISF